MTQDVRRALLGGLIDYAGLFPPAELPMDGAVAGFRAACGGDHRWVLDRFVCPAARLDEMSAELGDGDSWPVAATVGLADIESLFGYEGPLTLDAVELRLPPAAHPDALNGLGSRGTRCFVEVGLGESLGDFLDTLADEGLAAKVRCGGTAPAPEPPELAAFIVGCVTRDLAWKATAGLHHPFRDVDPATGERRHGFLNVLAAAGLAAAGAQAPDVAAVLADSDAEAFALDASGLRWRGHVIGAEARERFDGYGSCSFDEPIDDLVALGALSREPVRNG